jgi:Zn-dependent protease with chaperone function
MDASSESAAIPGVRAEAEPVVDPDRVARATARHAAVAAGLMPLPNLALRAGLTLLLLYGLLGLLLVTISLTGLITPVLALGLGVVIALVQYLVGPWILGATLSWLYRFRWVEPGELPEHLRLFVADVCGREGMRLPRFGIIDDGAPQAFTYGHGPGNARVVISRGVLELLDPAEVEAVVAHEIGHARNWDMVLMTLAGVVPLLAYTVFRWLSDSESSDGDDKKGAGVLVAVGAYVVYIVAEYLVLWFSRTREFAADRYAARVTGNPNALATALVKIGYGLAATSTADETPADGKTATRRSRPLAGTGALGAFNMFDQRDAVTLVLTGGGERTLDVGRVQGGMQWDLWNPWARVHEIHSTHPLVARRLEALADLAAALGQEPVVVFDRRQPESYWDEFFVDLLVAGLPAIAFLGGLPLLFWIGSDLVGGRVVTLANARAAWSWWASLLPLVTLAVPGLAMILKNRFSYRRGLFPHETVAGLLGRVKVSGVRTVPVTLTGRIIGKGVPGLVWSDDFVMQDSTGIILLDYRQPFGVWDFLFGAFGAQKFQGREVRVSGWYRRNPAPAFVIDRLEAEGLAAPVVCYGPRTRTWVGRFLLGAGVFASAVVAVLLVAG